MKTNVHASPEQNAYADILFYGCWLGLIVMVTTFLLYVSGIVSPHVPFEELSQYWGRPVSHYLEAAEVPTGWGWMSLIGQGDFLNFLGIALLAGLSMVCYLRVMPSLFRNSRIIGIIAFAEVVVLLVAASGIVGSGGH